MRTTIELSDEHYVALRTLAAQRGFRGFSRLINEAVDLLLRHEHDDSTDAALALAGSLSDEEAQLLDEHVQALRSRPARGDVPFADRGVA